MTRIEDILRDNGWTMMSTSDEPYINKSFNKGYTSVGFAEKVYHLHVRHSGDWDELYFRDYLIAHSEVAKRYGKMKLALLEEYRNDRDGYTDAKADFIKEYTERARKEFNGRYKPRDILLT